MLNKRLDNNVNLHENIKNVKLQAKVMEEKAKMKEMQMNLNGGAANNLELGEEVSEMYIDALKAKLSILNHLNFNKNI